MIRSFVSQPPSTFQAWLYFERKSRLSCFLGELLHPLIRSYFLLLLPGGSLPSFLLSPLWNPSSFSVELILSYRCSCFDPPFSRQCAALFQLSSLPPQDLVIWTNRSVLYPIDKEGSGVLANCSLCVAKATLFSFGRPNVSIFSCKNLCHFASSSLVSTAPTKRPPFFPSPLRFLLCPWYAFLSSVLHFMSHSLAYLAETIVSLLFLYHPATMGSWPLISPRE